MPTSVYNRRGTAPARPRRAPLWHFMIKDYFDLVVAFIMRISVSNLGLGLRPFWAGAAERRQCHIAIMAFYEFLENAGKATAPLWHVPILLVIAFLSII